jgi:dTDP-4-dehydrorhamnose 3,5-epimerase
MNVVPANLPGLLILEPKVYGDERGFFYESYNEKMLAEKAGITAHFVQDNHSLSVKNVLRGLHYQIRQPQGKLVRVISGEVFDVAVDLRKSSSTFGKWEGIILSAENKRIVWIPPGFAHGFLVLSDYAEFLYKTTDYWAPEYERCILWSDPDLGVKWPLQGVPALSAKDQSGNPFRDAEVFD